MKPACSVIVPTHNRAGKLDLLLCALAAQDTDQAFEVVVVLDGCTDSTIDTVRMWEAVDVFASFQWTERPRSGAATARNMGSLLATAPVLLFLDDDVLPEPNLISRHLLHHATGSPIAVLGDCDMVRNERPPLSELVAWMWWEDMYHRRAAEWQPPSYRDLCTGNVSVRREDFARAGGFDQDFVGYGREDYELGYRLMRSGVRFVADRRARARHLSHVALTKKLNGVRQEAHGDVLIAQKHPELIAGLRFSAAGGRREKVAAALAMHMQWLGIALCLALRPVLGVLERFKIRRRWLRTLAFVEAFAYWRGLRDALGSKTAVRLLQERSLPPLRQEVDISRDLGPQVQMLNIDVPSTLVIARAGTPIASIEIGPHIREPLLPWLITELSTSLTDLLLVEIAGTMAGPAAERVWNVTFE